MGQLKTKKILIEIHVEFEKPDEIVAQYCQGIVELTDIVFRDLQVLTKPEDTNIRVRMSHFKT